MNSSTSNFKIWLKVFAATSFIITFVFLLSAEILIRTKVQKRDVFEHHRALFFNSTAENVAFGDSHTSQGFTGQAGFINLAASYENLDVLVGKIMLYFSKKQPGKIILQVDPHFFSDYREKMNSELFLKDYESPEDPPILILTARHKINLLNYFKVFLKRGSFKSKFVLHKDGAQTLDDPMSQTYTANEIKSRIQKRVQLQLPASDFHSGKAANKLELIFSYLKNKNADVCLVSYPMSPQYLDMSKNFPQFSEAYAFIRQLADRYSYKYFNGSYVIDDPDLFSSEDHLNTAGARLFAEVAVNRCFNS